MMIIHSQNSTVPAPNIKLVNFERESDMTTGETRTVKVVIAAPQMSVRSIIKNRSENSKNCTVVVTF